MPGEVSELAARLESIDGRLARIESGFFGDAGAGYHGWVGRLEKLEGLAAEGPERVREEALQESNKIREEGRTARAQLAEKFDRIEDEWQRFKYIAVGIGIGSGVVSAGSVFGILELLGRG